MDPLTLYGIIQQLAGFIPDTPSYPKLKDEEGNFLPLYYGTHYRATADDLDEIWRDDHVICDLQTGIPVARWNQGKQEVQPVVGFTVQGLPVYSSVVRPRQHPVWSTKREVPPEFGSPGSVAVAPAQQGGLIPHWIQSAQIRRGEELVKAMGYYGPFEDPIAAPFFPPQPQRSSSGASGLFPALLGLGGAAAAVAGLWWPAGALFLLSALGSSPGPSSRGGPGAASTSAGKGLRN